MLEAARQGPVLDLACGGGRHARYVARLGARVVGLDRNRSSLRELRRASRSEGRPVETLQADLEGGAGIPLRPGCCAAVLVFRYLHRPLVPAIVELLAPGGLLLYETFTIHQRELRYGPTNPAFFLDPGELLGLFSALRIEAHREGLVEGERPLHLASLAARRP